MVIIFIHMELSHRTIPHNERTIYMIEEKELLRQCKSKRIPVMVTMTVRQRPGVLQLRLDILIIHISCNHLAVTIVYRHRDTIEDVDVA
ncbi:hypothetical protein D3C84_910080 [compost metagenome]